MSSSTPRRCARRWRSRGCCRRRAGQGVAAAAAGRRGSGSRGRRAVRDGRPREGFAYDNERPRHAVELAPFASPAARSATRAGWASARAAATSGASGGRRGLGLEGGVRHHPPSRVAAGHPEAPVCHVSWFEADAFARAHGARLPSEAEWEKAATWSSADDSAGWRTGALAGVGQVWEWTQTRFHGYPGFRPTPTASTPRSSSASATACCGAARGRPPARRRALRFRNWDLPSAARSSPACAWRREAIVMEAARSPPRGARRRRRSGSTRIWTARGTLAGRGRARRPHPPVQGAAAQALLRRARRRAVRPDLRAARVLPDAHRARDPRADRGRARRADRAVELVELGSGTAAKTRVLLDAMDAAGTLSATSPWTSPRAWSATAPRPLTDEYPGLRSTA